MEAWLVQTAILLPAIVIGLSFHEYAHARVADLLGDDTPYLQGRLTLNPIPHFDIIGLILILYCGFGWAKPVEVNPYRFKNMRVKEGMLLVSLAGPLMNLLIAIIGMLALKLIGINPEDFIAVATSTVAILLIPIVKLNLNLMILNLIPIPPLDGSKILAGLLPDSASGIIYSLERYGMLILLLLFVTGAFSRILAPLSGGLYSIIYGMFF